MGLMHENLKKKSVGMAKILKNEVLIIWKRRRNNLKETLWVVMFVETKFGNWIYKG